MAYGLGVFNTNIFSPALGKIGEGVSTGIERGQQLDYLKSLYGKKDSLQGQPGSKVEELELVNKQIAELEEQIKMIEENNKSESIINVKTGE